VTIPPEDAQKLLLLLRNPDADIANSAMEMLICFVGNGWRGRRFTAVLLTMLSIYIAQFRQRYTLGPTFWKLVVKLLQHPPTARLALKTITELAKYGAFRAT
jgi:hypothetical protein